VTWIQTFTGRGFTPLTPKVWDISVLDIAHSLSNQCRWNGHTRRFYSVAQHSVHVALYCSLENQLAALMHDSAEAYLSDLPTPLKKVMPQYRHFEVNLWETIAERFELSVTLPDEVHYVDRQMLAIEYKQLMEPCPAGFHWDYPPIRIPELALPAWQPLEARNIFLQLFYKLGGL
jgi:hypothetical protein